MLQPDVAEGHRERQLRQRKGADPSHAAGTRFHHPGMRVGSCGSFKTTSKSLRPKGRVAAVPYNAPLRRYSQQFSARMTLRACKKCLCVTESGTCGGMGPLVRIKRYFIFFLVHRRHVPADEQPQSTPAETLS